MGATLYVYRYKSARVRYCHTCQICSKVRLEGKSLSHYADQPMKPDEMVMSSQESTSQCVNEPASRKDSCDPSSPAEEVQDNEITQRLPRVTLLMYHRRRAALLTGLLTQGEQTPLTPEIAELTVHREQLQQQLQRLQAIIQEDQQNQGVQVERAPVIDLTQAIPAVATAQDAHTIATQPQAAPQAAPSDTKPAEQLPAAPRKRTRQPFWRHLLPRHIPVIHQMSAVECGAACLAMMLSYYGRKTSVSEVRERCNVGRDGLSALDIVKAARRYSLRGRSITVRAVDPERVS